MRGFLRQQRIPESFLRINGLIAVYDVKRARKVNDLFRDFEAIRSSEEHRRTVDNNGRLIGVVEKLNNTKSQSPSRR